MQTPVEFPAPHVAKDDAADVGLGVEGEVLAVKGAVDIRGVLEGR